MADCTDPKNQEIGGAFPNTQQQNTGGIQVNLTATEIFNPNHLLSAVKTYLSFNNVANKMLGIEARWFRAVPQQRSKDVIFQEYTLSNVEEEPLCIKVMVKDGQIPDSNYQYDLMGLEYQIPTTIEIDKKYWEEVAGFGTAPQKKDIVYLPMPNRLFQVESSYLKRGFMEQETTWVMNLVKYQPEASRKESASLLQTIDQYTVSQDEIFGLAIEADIEKLIDKKQMSPMNSTSQDIYKTVDPSVRILSYTLDVNGIVVSDAVYDLALSGLFDAVTYIDSSDNIKENYDRAVTSWIHPRTLTTEKEYPIVWMLPDTNLTYPANYKLKITTSKKFDAGDRLVIYRSKQLNLYAKIVDITYASSSIYWCQIDQTIIDHLNKILPQWWTKTNWKCKLKEPITILDGRNDEDTGFIVTINSNQYIKINYGSQEHIAILNEPLKDDNWYGIVVNIGNTWKQYNVYVWRPNLDITGNKLVNVFYDTLRFIPEETIINQYTINRSNSYMTNIRLFNSTIEEERQESELLSYFTQNADKTFINDSCDLRFTAPYISWQK